MNLFLRALSLLPSVVLGALLALAFISYLSPRVRFKLPKFSFRALAWCAAGFYAAYAFLLTVGQYLVWRGDPLGGRLLHSSLAPSLPIPLVKLFPGLFGSRFGYFLFYSWGRFWLHALLAVGAAALFWWFLRLLRRRNERFFEEGETELGFLAALVAGWPGVLPFLVLAFFLVIVLSLVRRAAFGEAFTTLGWPFLAAAAIALTFGRALAAFLGVSVLAV
jgi:hypothetical protein